MKTMVKENNPKKQEDSKVLKKFLQDVVSSIAGKLAEEMVNLLNSKKHVNEFIVAKKMDITVNQVRNMLYKLSDYGIVSYIRKKDRRKGWYTYFWRIEPLKSLEVLKDIVGKRISQIKNQISQREKNVFYICNRCNIEMDEENSLLNNFTCPECGSVFEIRDNSKLLKEFRKNLAKSEEELSFIEGELKGELEKKATTRLKENRKEEKKKKIERKKKFLERKKQKPRKAKKPVKKTLRKAKKRK